RQVGAQGAAMEGMRDRHEILGTAQDECGSMVGGKLDRPERQVNGSIVGPPQHPRDEASKLVAGRSWRHTDGHDPAPRLASSAANCALRYTAARADSFAAPSKCERCSNCR